MTQKPDDLWNALPPAYLARQQDGEAMADPTKTSSQAVKVARFLATMLEYDWGIYEAELLRTARWLLEKVGGDVDGLMATLEAKARDQKWLAWAVGQDVSIYAVRKILVDAYARRARVARERERAATTAGRKARYASYPGVQS